MESTFLGHLAQSSERKLPRPLFCITATVPESPPDVQPVIIQLFPWPIQWVVQFSAGLMAPCPQEPQNTFPRRQHKRNIQLF